MDLFDFFIQAIERERDARPPVELAPSGDRQGFDGDAGPATAPRDFAEPPSGDFTFPDKGDQQD